MTENNNTVLYTVKVDVKGRVTGVCFRFNAQDQAARYSDMRGYVRNASSGHVEAVLQGAKNEVQDFVNWFRKGPPGADVRSCDVKVLDAAEEYPPFQIRY